MSWLSRNLMRLGVNDWMTQNIPIADSADNDHTSDVIGNKDDTHTGNSIYSVLNLLDDHTHSASKVYPMMENGITITSNAVAWTLGAAATIVGTAGVTLDNAITTNPAGTTTRIPCTAHPYVAGNYVTIAGSVSNDGTYVITNVSGVNFFDIDDGTYNEETFGGAETVIDVIASPFDLHYLSIENLSANGVYEIVLYGDAVEIGRVRCTKNAVQDGTVNVPIQTVLLPASTVITAKAATNNAAGDTVTISIFYHVY